ncbi:MAG: MerR family transcriptional regulator [Acidimicrobiales bacterium]
MELRVEELARRTGMSVDTIRYYQGKGLLEPPRRVGRLGYYNDDHVTRLERVRALRERGFTLAAIARVVNGELDTADQALVSELSAGRGADGPDRSGGLTLPDLAARTGVPVGLLQALVTEGLLVPRRLGSEDRFTDEDVDAVRAGLSILERGVPYDDVLALARRYHEATAAVAAAAVDLFANHVRSRLRAVGTDADRAEERHAQLAGDDPPELVEAYTDMLSAVTTLVGHHFTRVLLRAALSHIEQEHPKEHQGDLVPAGSTRVGS